MLVVPYIFITLRSELYYSCISLKKYVQLETQNEWILFQNNKAIKLYWEWVGRLHMLQRKKIWAHYSMGGCSHGVWLCECVHMCVVPAPQPQGASQQSSPGESERPAFTFTTQRGRTVHTVVLDIDLKGKSRHLPPATHPFPSPLHSLTVLSPTHQYLKTQLVLFPCKKWLASKNI